MAAGTAGETRRPAVVFRRGGAVVPGEGAVGGPPIVYRDALPWPLGAAIRADGCQRPQQPEADGEKQQGSEDADHKVQGDRSARGVSSDAAVSIPEVSGIPPEDPRAAPHGEHGRSHTGGDRRSEGAAETDP